MNDCSILDVTEHTCKEAMQKVLDESRVEIGLDW